MGKFGFRTGIEIADGHGISEEEKKGTGGDGAGDGGFGELVCFQNLAENFGNGLVGLDPDIPPNRLGLDGKGIQKLGNASTEESWRLVPRIEVFGEAADLEIIFAATGSHPLAEALGNQASAEMQDALGGRNISALENPVGVTNNARKQPRAGEGIGDQGPAETLGEIEQKRGVGLLGETEASNENDAVRGIEKMAEEGPACQVRGGFRNDANPALTSRALLARRGFAVSKKFGQNGLGERNIQVNRTGFFACGGGDEVFQNGGECG
jgi:hypothetical protein